MSTANTSETIEVEIHGTEEGSRNHETRTSQKTMFNFDEWTVQNGINRKSTKILREQDICTMDTITKVSSSELLSVGITLGQAKVIVGAALDMNNSKGQGSTPQTVPPPGQTSAAPDIDNSQGTTNQPSQEKQGVSLRDIRQQATQLGETGRQFDHLFHTFTDTSVPTSNNEVILNQPISSTISKNVTKFNRVVPAADPRAVLTIKACSQKAIHITQFLSEKTKKRLQYRRKNLILSELESGESQLTVKADDMHPYSGIFIDEWGAANMRLLNHLLSQGILSREDIEFYLAYTTTVFEFANKYDWSSVLDFDHQYREQQAQLGFQWGEINPLMELQLLIPKQQSHKRNHVHGNPRSGKSANYVPRNNLAIEECRQYKANQGFCHFGDRCRYKHVPLQSKNNHESSPKNGQ